MRILIRVYGKTQKEVENAIQNFQAELFGRWRVVSIQKSIPRREGWEKDAFFEKEGVKNE